MDYFWTQEGEGRVERPLIPPPREHHLDFFKWGRSGNDLHQPTPTVAGRGGGRKLFC